MNRIGTGWDIHKLVEGRDLILGGVKISSDKGCLGHSDGDALIHAIIDALFGAAAMGDIGTFFPDSDSRYKDISSLVLLKKTAEIIANAGYRIANIDATVILQKPKLADYKGAMCVSIAEALNIDLSLVSVKAKTAETMLGELGTGDAVVAQAVVLLER